MASVVKPSTSHCLLCIFQFTRICKKGKYSFYMRIDYLHSSSLRELIIDCSCLTVFHLVAVSSLTVSLLFLFCIQLLCVLWAVQWVLGTVSTCCVTHTCHLSWSNLSAMLVFVESLQCGRVDHRILLVCISFTCSSSNFYWNFCNGHHQGCRFTPPHCRAP